MKKKESTLREEDNRKERISGYLNEFLKESNLRIENIKKSDVDKFIEIYLIGESRPTLYSNISTLGYILRENNINIMVGSSDYVDKIKYNSNKYFTRREIQNICNEFQNAQDKFIVYGLWTGIMRKDYVDLVTLKVKDVAEDYSYIQLPDRRILCDDYMKSILKDTIEAEEYSKNLDPDSSSEPVGGMTYDFNMSSPYVIKIKPTKKNNDGLDHMKKIAIQTRLAKLSKVFSDMNIHLTGKSLERGGIIFNMFIIEAYEQKEWTIEKVAEYMLNENIKGNPVDTYRTYHQKYHNSTVLD